MDDFGFDVRIAWRRDDSEIEADAIDFWARNELLPHDVDPAERAKGLIAAAYMDGRLAAVATATLGSIDLLRARFAIIRGATDRDFRRSNAQLALAVPSREALAGWAAAHPEEGIAGAIAFVDPSEWGDFAKRPVWPGSELELAGYDQLGQQVRVRWFEHFLFEGEAPQLYPSGTPPFIPSEIEIRPAWRLGDARIEADAIAFWERLNNLPRRVTPQERARELVLAAYQEDRLVGVVTAELGILLQVRARMAMLRGAVDPDLRRSHVAVAMMTAAPRILESWATEHPDERLGGVGGIVESRELMAAQNMPYWRPFRFGLIGFTPDGRQIRVSWFRDFRLD